MKRKHTHRRPKRLWHGLMSRLMVKAASTVSTMEVEGLENLPRSGGAVIIANHFSYFDAVALAAALEESKRDAMVLAKAELVEGPLGPLLRRVGVIPVHRNSARASESLSEAVNSLRHGEVVALFPEGTIHQDGVLMNFKTGAARMALQAEVPVIPVAMVGTNSIIASNLKKVKRTLWKRTFVPSAVKVRVGEPIWLSGDPEEKVEVAAATALLQSTLEAMLYDLGYGKRKSVLPTAIKKREVAWGLLAALPLLGLLLRHLRRR